MHTPASSHFVWIADMAPVVSHHALLRYLERCCGFGPEIEDLDRQFADQNGRSPSDSESIDMVLNEFNLSRDKIEAMILTPDVVAAIEGGAATIRRPEYTMRIINSVIVTILPPNQGGKNDTLAAKIETASAPKDNRRRSKLKRKEGRKPLLKTRHNYGEDD